MMEPLYEKAKQKEDKLLRIFYMLFDYKNNILPPWQPHQRDPRTCCHHHLHEKIELLYFIEGTVIFRVDGTPYTFDPQIEAVYAANYGINYDLYKKAYGTTPIT